jgi:hypothetical protein
MSLRSSRFGFAIALAGFLPAMSCNNHAGHTGVPDLGGLDSEVTPDLGGNVDGNLDLNSSGDGGNPSGGDGGVDMSIDGPVCLAAGDNCTVPGDCCSGACDATAHICVVPMCHQDGESCQNPTDCCNLNCANGVCGMGQCVSDGQDCIAPGSVCCSTICGSDGKCTALNTCKTAGNECSTNVDCCNQMCLNGRCAAPSQVSYCTQVGDICFNNNECCTGVCTIGSGASAGTCTDITPTASNCKVDGTLCEGCNGCCSSFCAPFGNTESHICQPASGCHVFGDLCKTDLDCCGGDFSSGLPGAGLVKCMPVPGHPEIGTCGKPNTTNCPDNNSDTCKNSCIPEGDVCHYTGLLVCASNSQPDNCCAAPGNSGVCMLDRLNIPRCYGLGTSCVNEGESCASSQDCCDGVPCLPDDTGHLKCAAMSCVPENGICTTTSDCCTGFACQVPPGELRGTCINPNPPPPPPDAGTADFGDTDLGDASNPPADLGTPDLSQVDQAPQCAFNGQDCSTSTPCCLNAGGCYEVNSTTACVAGDTKRCVCAFVIL